MNTSNLMYAALWLEQVKGLLGIYFEWTPNVNANKCHVTHTRMSSQDKTIYFTRLLSFFLGASPGNIFICNCCGRICAEYKCPFNIKDMSILEERSKTDFLESQEGKIRLRRRHKYYTQVIYSIGKQSLLTLLSS